MKNLLFYILMILLLIAIGAFLFGHFQFAFGVGFVLIILFLSIGSYYGFANLEYTRKKGKDPRK